MELPELGTLKEVDARRAWSHEAHSFTPWLAQHLDALSHEIGIPLELEGQEVAVETFSADILARNPQDDTLVLIENQLATADHSHLGQIMTYLAGLEAQTIIWIALDFRDAHLSAVRWLNDHTSDDYAFFAVKVKVVQIGDSPLAPVFEVVTKPNRWEKKLQTLAKETQNVSEVGQRRKAFWTHYLARHPEEARDGDAGGYSNRWRHAGGLVISYYIAADKVGLFIRGRRGVEDSDVVEMLRPHEAVLSRELGVPMFDQDGNFTYFVVKQSANTADETRWDALTDWLHDQVIRYESVLRTLTEE